MLDKKSYKLIPEYSPVCALPFSPTGFYVLPSLHFLKGTKHLEKSIKLRPQIIKHADFPYDFLLLWIESGNKSPET
jgi:hypothetical protein